MENAREQTAGMSYINNFGMPLHLCKEIVKKTNLSLSDIDIPVVNLAFSLGVEEVLKEIAALKMVELAGERAAIESNANYNEVWSTLQNLDDELYDKLEYNQAEIADKNFVLGFVEGYLMMKMIAENNE